MDNLYLFEVHLVGKWPAYLCPVFKVIAHEDKEAAGAALNHVCMEGNKTPKMFGGKVKKVVRGKKINIPYVKEFSTSGFPI